MDADRCEGDFAAIHVKQLEAALRAITEVPSRRTLLLNAEAKAMYALALRALEGSWGEPYEEAMLRGK